MGIFSCILPIILFFLYDVTAEKKPRPYNVTLQAPRYDNPNYVRDRYKNEIYKPQMPQLFKERHHKPFNTAWMDYCDPYHCNDYHKTACGLNRKTMKFRWFQSVCHVILNNQCANYRGTLKYDLVNNKFCTIYVMYLRTGCPSSCDDEEKPVCGISSINNDVVLFKSKCALDMMNCRKELQEFDEVNMSLCVLKLDK